MATHSSTLAWKIPWTEKPRRLQSPEVSWTWLSGFTKKKKKKGKKKKHSSLTCHLPSFQTPSIVTLPHILSFSLPLTPVTSPSGNIPFWSDTVMSSVIIQWLSFLKTRVLSDNSLWQEFPRLCWPLVGSPSSPLNQGCLLIEESIIQVPLDTTKALSELLLACDVFSFLSKTVLNCTHAYACAIALFKHPHPNPSKKLCPNPQSELNNSFLFTLTELYLSLKQL